MAEYQHVTHRVLTILWEEMQRQALAEKRDPEAVIADAFKQYLGMHTGDHRRHRPDEDPDLLSMFADGR